MPALCPAIHRAAPAVARSCCLLRADLSRSGGQPRTLLAVNMADVRPDEMLAGLLSGEDVMVAVDRHVLLGSGPADQDRRPWLLPLLDRPAHFRGDPLHLACVLRPTGVPLVLVGHVDLIKRHHLRALPRRVL